MDFRSVTTTVTDFFQRYLRLRGPSSFLFLDDARPPPTDPLGVASPRGRLAAARLVRSPPGEAGQRQGKLLGTSARVEARGGACGPRKKWETATPAAPCNFNIQGVFKT
eukprot:1175328-Prorocentrum_minimum.AAC.1